MIKLSSIEDTKILLKLMTDTMEGGALFYIVKNEVIEWSIKSDMIKANILPTGKRLDYNDAAVQAYQYQRKEEQFIPRSVYGMRLHVIAVPIMDEDDKIYGSLAIALPMLDPIAASFGEFAPILVEMFSDGSFMYMSDLDKIMFRQPSAKFDVPDVIVGYDLKEEDIAYQVIRTKKPMMREIDATRYGIPVYIACFPLFDVDHKDIIVATLGIILPKQTATTLKEMAKDLEESLNNISAAIQELAASATEINANEEKLNRDVKGIVEISNEINGISGFIKEIAEETKLLGLNAAIEAARSGEAGRGFGVVADEIRKLSAESKSTVPKITSLTEQIIKKVEVTSQNSLKSLDASQEQAASTEEITSNIEEITLLASKLGEIAAAI